MANLSLVGAVGIRVRPDTDGFKPETRAKVMSALRGVEGTVPVHPEVQDTGDRVAARVKEIAKRAGTKAQIKLEIDSKQAEAEAKRVAKAMERHAHAKFTVEADVSKAEDELRELRGQAEETRKAYEAMSGKQLDRLARTQQELVNSGKTRVGLEEHLVELQEKHAELSRREAVERAQAEAKAVEQAAKLERVYDRTSQKLVEKQQNLAMWQEKAREQTERSGQATARTMEMIGRRTAEVAQLERDRTLALRDYERARKAAAETEGAASKATQDAIAKSTKAIQAQEKAISKAVREQAKLQEQVTVLEQERKEASEARAVEVGRELEALLDQEQTYKRLKERAEETLAAETDLLNVRTMSSKQLHEMLNARRAEGESLLSVLDKVLARSGQLDADEFKGLRDLVSRDFTRDRVAKLRVEADTAVAEGQLQLLERDRHVRVYATVDHSLAQMSQMLQVGGTLDKGITNITSKYARMFSGGAQSIAGLSAIKRMNDLMVASTANMERAAVAAANLGTVMGALGGTLVAATGGISALGKSLVELGRGAAIAPAAILSLGTAFAVSRRGMATFFGGLGEGIDELRKVSPVAADAASALKKLGSEADQAGQRKFFAQMESELSRLPETIRPLMGLWEDAYDAQGKFFNGILSGVNAWFDSGDMASSVKNIGSALHNASGSAKPFTQSLLDLTTVGSKYMPQLAQSITDVTNKWAIFIRTAKDSGRIDEWIVEAGHQMEYLGKATMGAIGILGAFGKAADAAGYGGLKSLASGLQVVSDKLNSPLWQTGMANIFRGAAEGAAAASRGFGILGDSVMKTSKYWEDFGRTTGDTAGTFASNVGFMLTNSRMLTGVEKFIGDVNKAAGNSKPMFRDMGDAFGQAASTGGELVKSTQQIGAAFFRTWADLGTLTDGVNAAIPVFTNFAVGALDTAHVYTSILGDALGNLLKWFSNLPGPVQTAIIALGLFGGAMSKLGGYGNIIGALGNRFPVLARQVDSASRAMSSFRTQWELAGGAVKEYGSFNEARAGVLGLGNGFLKAGSNMASFRVSMQQVSSGLSDAGGYMRDYAAHAQGAVGPTRNFGGAVQNVARGALGAGAAGLRGALSGVIGVLGGPWGVALLAAGAALTMFAQKSADAKRVQSELRASLSDQGGTTAETVRALNDALDEQTEKYTGAKLFSERYGEAIRILGETESSLSKQIAESGGAWTDYRQNLEDGLSVLRETNGAHADAAHLSEEQAKAIFGTSEAAKLSGAQLQNLATQYDGVNQSLQDAQRKQREYAEAMGLTTAEGQALSKAMETIGNSASSTAEKASAFKTAMDIANGGTRAMMESVTAQNTAMGQLGDAFKQVADAGVSGADAMTTYKDAAGKTHYVLDTTKSSVSGLQSAMLSSYDATTQNAQAMYDNAIKSGKTVGEAAEIAQRSMSDWRSSAQQQLQQMGVDADQARSYLDDIAGKPWVAEVTFMGKTEEYMKAQQLVESSGKRFDGAAFTAFLKANPDMAESDIEGLIKRGVVWSSSRFTSTFDADGNEAKATVSEVIADGETFDHSEYKAMLKGDNSGFLETFIAAQSKGIDWNSKEFRAMFGADSKALDAAVDSAKQQGMEFGSNKWIAYMDLENPGFAEKLFAAKHGLEGVSQKDWPVEVKDNFAQVKAEQEKLTGGLNSLDGKVADVTVKSNASAEALILQMYQMRADGMNDQEIRQRLGLDADEWNTLVDGLPGHWDTVKSDIESDPAKISVDDSEVQSKFTLAQVAANNFASNNGQGPYKAGLGVKDEGVQEGTGQAKASLNDFATNGGQGQYKAGLGADSSGVQTGVDNGRSIGSFFEGLTFLSHLGANSGGVQAGVDNGRIIGGLFSGLSFISNLGANSGGVQTGVNTGRGIGLTFSAMKFIAGLLGNNKPFSAAKGAASALGGVFNREKFTSTLTGNRSPFNGVKRAASLLGGVFNRERYTSTLSGNNRPFFSAKQVATGQGYSFRASRFPATLTANVAMAGPLRSAIAAGMSWQGRVFSATLNAVKKHFANGGIVDGRGVQQFANGGFTVSRFAGGSENHRAMIARPSVNYRVWAEPETGGEAYIPLASSKRSRSTQIMGQVAERFGYTVTKYAEGGMQHVGGVQAPVSGPSINYTRLGRAVADGIAQQGVRVTNPGDFEVAGRRR